MTTAPSPAFTAEAGDLLRAIDRVKHAMADDDRPILASFVIEEHADGVRLAAADNYRVALQIVETAERDGDWPQTVVARDGVPILRDFLTMVGKLNTVRVERLDVRLRVSRQGSGSAEVRLIDGQYPDLGVVTNVAPGEVVAVFNPKYLADAGRALKTAGIVTVRGRDPLAAVQVTDGDGYTEYIMPVRVS